MATAKCDSTKVIGQTLFLGASVVSININLGWGVSQSTCTVDLIEDFQPITCYKNNRPISHFPLGSYGDNHYYDCASDVDCYVDELGDIYNPDRVDQNGDPYPPKEKNVPGKIYYVWNNNGVVSRYWYDEDPGFFATGTKINPDGTVGPIANNVYNIIGVPVFFKFDNMTFTGIIKSWESNFNNGKNYYKVVIESAGSLLENSYIILDKYAGSIFSILPNDLYGAPRNYTGPLNATATIRSGNIHNVFNVYGFLDSLGPYGFGGANKNDQGISYRKAVQALKALTSTIDKNKLLWKSKNIFSPFGRLLGKVMQLVGNESYVNISPSFRNHAFGVIPPTLDANGIPRVEFSLDLSELILPPDDSRISAKSSALKISEFLNQLLQQNGQLSYWTQTQSMVHQGNPYNIIKVKTVSRQNYIKPYTINYVIGQLANQGYAATASSASQIKNKEANVRTMYIGGRQQRLYQVKNYRLAFNQDNYIWNPVVGQFIDFRRFDDAVTDKYKIPSGLSVRNPNLANQVTGNYTSIINTDETVKTLITGTNFNTLDRVWKDNIIFSRTDPCDPESYTSAKNFSQNINSGQSSVEKDEFVPGIGVLSGNIGNYIVGWTAKGSPLSVGDKKSNNTSPGIQAPPSAPPPPATIPAATSNASGEPDEIVTVIDQSTRYIPIYKDSICPFFGFKFERSFPISQDSNTHRYIRPVWLDSWTGQLCVIFDLNELPPISCGALVSVYDKGLFNKNSADVGGSTAMTPDPDDTAAGGSATTPANLPVIPLVNPTAQSLPDVTPALIRDPNQFAGTGFIITESEMRCAMAGWESYLKYCLAKSPSTKPDLFLMLLNCWKNKGVQISNEVTPLDGNRTGMTAQSDLEGGINHGVGQTNIAGVAGQPGPNTGKQQTKVSNINFSMLLHPGFIADFKILNDFVKDLGERYYGKQFMVKMPYMQSYRDTAYSRFNIPGFRGGDVFVYSGSGKIFYQYDLTSSAWEEWGNYIDDAVVVGGPYWLSLSDEKGMIPPLLGFNASDKVDYVKKTWCQLSALEKAKKLAALRKQAVDSLAVELNQFSNIFEYDIPLDNNLNNWTINIKCPNTIKDSDGNDVPNSIQSCADNGFIELTGNETDDFIQSTLGLTPDAFKVYKKYQNLKRQAAAIAASGPAAIECSPSEYITENGNNSKQIIGVTSNDNAFLIPSIKWSSLGSDGKDYIVVPYNVGFISAYNDKDADSCKGGKKIYKKASLVNDGKVVFGSPEFLTDPRAIISIPTRIELNTTSYVYEHDPNLYVMPNVAAEDISFYRIVKKVGTNYIITERGQKKIEGQGAFTLTQDETDHMTYLESKFLTPLIVKGALLSEGSTINVPTGHRKMVAKAAQPFFAAIPTISNRYVYGPWTNYPDLNKKQIWNYVANPDTIVENLVDNLKVEQKDEFVPWNYGGMSWLDKNVITEINYQENYLTSEENGSIKILGPPIYTIGSQFSSNSNTLTSPYVIKTESITVNDYEERNSSFDIQTYDCLYLDESSNYYPGYPFIQGISISVGIEGVSTNYSIGSYNPKMGQFNKELSDAQKNLNLKLIELNNKLDSNSNFNNNQQNLDLRNMIEDLSRVVDRKFETATFNDGGGMFGNSPSELLIGQSRYFIPLDRRQNQATDMMKNRKIESWAGMFVADEVGPELVRGYNTKAAMSLDGIFSPISFYPTIYHSTHNISNYSTTFNLLPSGSKLRDELYCHICKNARYIEDTFVAYPNSENRNIKDYPCPNCNSSVVAYDKNIVKPQKDKAPRVVLDPKSKKPLINFYSLNPIVVSIGEFSNPNAYPSGTIANTHSIRTVSRGESVPGSESNLDNFTNLSKSNDVILPSFEAYDYESKAIDGLLYSNNQRFFGLRGPLVVHGWGYDTDGYPVPNYSDEPKDTDEFGRHLRFIQDKDGFNDLTKEGLYVSTNTDVKLGDIISKRYTWDGTEWKRAKKPTKYFSENWAAKSDTWPVGPVDLRWDHEKRVWVGGNAGCGEELLPPYIITNKIDPSTLADYIEEKTTSGCPYKMVYVTLEQDLTRSPDVYFYTNAVRGFIDDLEYISEPLPNGYRRLVYIIDRSGYTAPAGVRLLCRYNPDLGFYEPISKPNIVALGIISGGQANISKAYAKSKSGSGASDITVNFSNPLNFDVTSGSRGVFSFIDGEWTLTSAESK